MEIKPKSKPNKSDVQQYSDVASSEDMENDKKNIKFKNINKDFLEKLNDLNGQALHAKSLGFIHPANGDFVNFNSKPPEAFRNLLNLLENLSS